MFSLWPARQLSWCRNKPKSLRTVEKWCQATQAEKRQAQTKVAIEYEDWIHFVLLRTALACFSNTVHKKPHSFYMAVRSGVVWDWGCFSAGPSARLASIWGQMVFSLVRQLSLLDQLRFKIKTKQGNQDTKYYETKNNKSWKSSPGIPNWHKSTRLELTRVVGSAQGVTQTKERDRTGPLSHTLTPVDRSFLSCYSKTLKVNFSKWGPDGDPILTLGIFTNTNKFSFLPVTDIYPAEFAVYLLGQLMSRLVYVL